MGMMGTTGQVTGNAMLKGQLRRQNRSGRSQESASDEALAPGQIHLPFLPRRELIAGETGKVIRAVGTGQPRLPAWGRAKAIGLSEKPSRAGVIGKEPEFFHGKSMLCREWEAVVWMVNHGYWHWIVRLQ
jgi:hypothetical protein